MVANSHQPSPNGPYNYRSLATATALREEITGLRQEVLELRAENHLLSRKLANRPVRLAYAFSRDAAFALLLALVLFFILRPAHLNQPRQQPSRQTLFHEPAPMPAQAP